MVDLFQALQVGEEVAELVAGEELFEAGGHGGKLLAVQRGDVVGSGTVDDARTVARTHPFRPLPEEAAEDSLTIPSGQRVGLVTLGEGAARIQDKFKEVAAGTNRPDAREQRGVVFLPRGRERHAHRRVVGKNGEGLVERGARGRSVGVELRGRAASSPRNWGAVRRARASKSTAPRRSAAPAFASSDFTASANTPSLNTGCPAEYALRAIAAARQHRDFQRASRAAARTPVPDTPWPR